MLFENFIEVQLFFNAVGQMQNTTCGLDQFIIKVVFIAKTNGNRNFPIIDNIIDDLKYFDQAEKVTLHREIDSNIVLKSDPKRIKIVLSNLISTR